MPPRAGELAVRHWNETPLLVSEEERYSFYPWLPEAAEFREHRGDKVLEVGCGTGCDLLQFARNGAHAVGIDITPAHIRLAQQRVDNLAQVCFGDATAIPFGDASFDYVYSCGVLHHLDDPGAMVAEILRVLRPGGRFNVHVYALWSYVPVVLFFQHGRDWRRWVENSRVPVHLDLYTGPALRRLFAPVDIRIQKYHCSYFQPLGRICGWFLVVKGTKPALPTSPR
jgi:SAM-dependent methyltransferase